MSKALQIARMRIFRACRNHLAISESAVKWALVDATCEDDLDVRILCLESAPKHLSPDRLLMDAQEAYTFAHQGETDPETPPSGGPGAPPGRRAGTRSPRRA